MKYNIIHRVYKQDVSLKRGIWQDVLITSKLARFLPNWFLMNANSNLHSNSFEYSVLEE